MKRHCVSVQIGEEERIKEWRCQRDVCSQWEEKKKEKEKKNTLFFCTIYVSNPDVLMTRQKRPCLPSWPVSLLRCFGFVLGFFPSCHHSISSETTSKSFGSTEESAFWAPPVLFALWLWGCLCTTSKSSQKKKRRTVTQQSKQRPTVWCLVASKQKILLQPLSSVVFRLGCKTKVQNLTQKKKKKKKKVSWRFCIVCTLIDWFLSRRKICLWCGETLHQHLKFSTYIAHFQCSVFMQPHWISYQTNSRKQDIRLITSCSKRCTSGHPQSLAMERILSWRPHIKHLSSFK